MINQVFDKTVATYSDRVVLVEGERQFSYFELHVYVEWMARYFQSLGIQPGHRLAIFMPNTHELIISLLGLFRLHGVAVPLSTDSSAADIRATLEAAKAHAVITIPRYRELMMEILSSAPEGAWPLRKLPLAVFEEDNIATSPGASLLPPAEKAHALPGPAPAGAKKNTNGHLQAVPAPEAMEEDFAAVLFLESHPERQLVPLRLSHRELLAEAEKLVASSQLTCDDCILSELQFAHTRGFATGLLAGMATGAKIILAETTNAAALLRTITGEHVTVYSGYPVSFERLAAAAAEAAAIGELRMGWCEGEAVPAETVQVLQQHHFQLQVL